MSRELQEMRLAVSQLNKKLLLYYSHQDSDNAGELLVNLKKFFERTRVEFYPELLKIAHPHLTKYIFGEQVKQLVSQQIVGLDQHTSKEQLNAKLSSIISQLIYTLQEIHSEHKIDALSNFKRRGEIVDRLRSIILDESLSQDIKECILSNDFSQTIDSLVKNRRDSILDRGNRSALSASSSSLASIYSEENDQELLANKIFEQMQELKEGLGYFQRSIIEYCQLIMPQYNPVLLKNILEDEKSIKLTSTCFCQKNIFLFLKSRFLILVLMS